MRGRRAERGLDLAINVLRGLSLPHEDARGLVHELHLTMDTGRNRLLRGLDLASGLRVAPSRKAPGAATQSSTAAARSCGESLHQVCRRYKKRGRGRHGLALDVELPRHGEGVHAEPVLQGVHEGALGVARRRLSDVEVVPHQAPQREEQCG